MSRWTWIVDSVSSREFYVQLQKVLFVVSCNLKGSAEDNWNLNCSILTKSQFLCLLLLFKISFRFAFISILSDWPAFSICILYAFIFCSSYFFPLRVPVKLLVVTCFLHPSPPTHTHSEYFVELICACCFF